jgi:hypothetical protein
LLTTDLDSVDMKCSAADRDIHTVHRCRVLANCSLIVPELARHAGIVLVDTGCLRYVEGYDVVHVEERRRKLMAMGKETSE